MNSIRLASRRTKDKIVGHISQQAKSFSCVRAFEAVGGLSVYVKRVRSGASK